jgi:hypothetical protein
MQWEKAKAMPTTIPVIKLDATEDEFFFFFLLILDGSTWEII